MTGRQAGAASLHRATDHRPFSLCDNTGWGTGIGWPGAASDVPVTSIDTDLSDSECAEGCDGRMIFGISRSF